MGSILNQAWLPWLPSSSASPTSTSKRSADKTGVTIREPAREEVIKPRFRARSWCESRHQKNEGLFCWENAGWGEVLGWIWRSWQNVDGICGEVDWSTLEIWHLHSFFWNCVIKVTHYTSRSIDQDAEKFHCEKHISGIWSSPWIVDRGPSEV